MIGCTPTHAMIRSAFGVLLGVALLAVTGCATLPREYPRPSSEAWGHPEQTAIGRAFAGELAAHPELSAFHLLPGNVDAFAARVALAEAAQRTLDLQYYTVANDDATNTLLSRVAAAAERGVRVRLLVDDFYVVGRDVDVAAFAAHPNIEVRVFNPFLRRGPLGVSRFFELIGDTARLNHRMHNKLFVADNAAAVIGGRNLGNEYFGAESEAGFVDLDVLVLGPVVRQASTSFDEYWRSEWAIPIEAFVSVPPPREDVARVIEGLHNVEQRTRTSEFGRRVQAAELVEKITTGRVQFTWARAQAVADPPGKGKPHADDLRDTHIRPQLRSLLGGVRSEIVLVSPYFVPGAPGLAQLTQLRERGVAVRVLTNSLAGTDMPVVYAGYSRYHVALLQAGVELYELRPSGGSRDDQERLVRALGSERATLHAKTFVVDRRYVFVGSMNLDPRSDAINTEFGMLIDSPELSGQLLALLGPLTAPQRSYRLVLSGGHVEWVTEVDGQPVRTTSPPDAGTGRRINAAILSVLAPEELL